MILYASGSIYLRLLGPLPLPGPPWLHEKYTHVQKLPFLAQNVVWCIKTAIVSTKLRPKLEYDVQKLPYTA